MTLGAPTQDEDASVRPWNRFALAAIVVGAVIRLVWALGFHRPFDYLYSDALGYWDRAKTLAHGGPFVRYDLFYPPGTHALLAGPLKLFGTGTAGMWADAVLWSLLSCLIPLLAWRISLRLLSVRGAAIAAALCAFWPLFIVYGGFFMAEIPSITFLLASILSGLKTEEVSGRRRLWFAALAAGFGGVAIVMRPQLGLNVLVVAWLLLRRTGLDRRVAAAAAVGLLIPIASVVALNTAVAGRLSGISQNAGVSFFQAHCPSLVSYHEGLDVPGYYFMAAPPNVQLNRGRDYVFPGHPPTDQSFLFQQGFRCIRDDGIKHVGVVLRNVADMGLTTVPWPPSNERGLRRFVRPANVIYSVALPAIVVGAVMLARRKRRAGEAAGENILLAHLAAMIPMAIIFVGDPRYRLPYDAFGLALAASLIAWGLHALRERRAARTAAPTADSSAKVQAILVEE